jgi:hypothetical protein
MNPEWDDDEEEFDSALSQRTEELYRVPNQTPDENGIIEAMALPMRDMVVFPHMVSPVFVDNDAAIATLQSAHEHDQTVIGIVQKDPETEKPEDARFPAGRHGNGGRTPAFNARWGQLGPGAGTATSRNFGVHAHCAGDEGARAGDR